MGSNRYGRAGCDSPVLLINLKGSGSPMGYTVPLRFIRISSKRSDNRQFDVSICATRIIAIMSTEIYQARKVVSDERKNGTLINACGLSKAKSATPLI